MSDFDLRKLQLKELEILNEVDRICKKHGIKYYLTWGTALGAVRHGGFIPWDDDIDISMYWDDYIKFEEICKKELGEDFFFQTTKTDEGHFKPYNKIRINNTTSMPREYSYMKMHWGICMDIFPIIDIPESSILRLIQRFNVSIYLNTCKIKYYKLLKYSGKNLVKIVVCMVSKLIPLKICNTIQNIMIKQVVKYKSDKFCGEILDQKYNDAILEKSIFGEGYAIKFEDKIYHIPNKYKKYLSNMYGDYMKLPDDKERIGHGDIIVDFNKDYKHYLSKK